MRIYSNLEMNALSRCFDISPEQMKKMAIQAQKGLYLQIDQ